MKQLERDLLEYAESMQCQELHMNVDEETGLKMVIAIHNTILGPALGGCRCIPYPSTTAAVIDAIRLAQCMAYKAAISNLPLGGGKAVLLRPKTISDRTAYFKAVGRFINQLNGRYITAVDSGTTIQDMDVIATETRYVTTTSHGVFTVADPSSLTAFGVLRGMQAAAKFKLGKDSLKGLHVAIQGLGHVGYSLAKLLYNEGARLTVFDIDKNAVNHAVSELKAASTSSLDAILKTECDIFAPCAFGGLINDKSIAMLRAPIVAGCANNQLEEPYHGEALARRGILYAPDYVINAGGLIYVAAQYNHITEDVTLHKIEGIYDTLMHIFDQSEIEKRTTSEVADNLAKQYLQKS